MCLRVMGVFLGGVFEGVGGRGLDSSALPRWRPGGFEGRPNQLSSAHRQGPGVDTVTAGGQRPPSDHRYLSQAGVQRCEQTFIYIVRVYSSLRSAFTAINRKATQCLQRRKRCKMDVRGSTEPSYGREGGFV